MSKANEIHFLIVIEKANRNYSAFSPDLPGCVASGRTRKQAEANMHAAIQMHIEGLIEDGIRVPASTSSAAYVIYESQGRKRSTTTRPSNRKSL
jgi:predicted RNase H-like HicB family nuclease